VYPRRSYAEQNPIAIEGFLRALMQGNQAVLTQPEQTKTVLQKYLTLGDPEDLEASYQDNVRGTEPTLAPSLTGLKGLINQTVQQNPGIRGVRAEQFVDLRFIDRIEASGFMRDLGRH
jgi:ABC-type nitrate/sulfonate/bicarbonate transport system substrate-binding protein